MSKKIFTSFFFVLLAVSSSVFGQFGSIEGVISEKETNELLIGATIRVYQDSVLKNGAYTDEEGKFKIERLAPGKYDLIISYVSLDPINIDGVEVVSGQITYQEIQMGVDLDASGKKNEVVITSKLVRNTETTVLTVQRKSANVMDGISYEQVKRAGDSNAGSAMRRVTGVTVEGGKYVYVRGLGDRYTKALLNGGEIPSLDPDRNTVQMDMFPSNLIDNIVVYKTFTPDLPGSFTGGLIDISTKDFPDKFTFLYSGSVGINTQSSFSSDFLTYETGKLDWLGMDDGTRALPDEVKNGIPNINFTDAQVAGELDAATRSFGTKIYPTRTNSLLDHSHMVSLGNQGKLFGRPLGYIASVSYNNQYNYYNNGITGRYKLVDRVDVVDNLNREIYVKDEYAQRNVLVGGLVNLSYIPAPRQKFSINFLRNQSGNSGARIQEGELNRDANDLYYYTNRLEYTERSMNAFQVKGDHEFENAGGLKVDWIGSATFSRQNEPDLRFFTYDYTIQNGDTTFDIQPNLYDPPSRYYRELQEQNYDFKLNVMLPIEMTETRTLKIKGGGAVTRKVRDFAEFRYEYDYNPSNVSFDGNPDDFFAEENLGVIGYEEPYDYGIYLKDGSELRNQYDAEQTIYAGYAMADFPITEKLQIIGGARYELTDIFVKSREELQPGILFTGDILPSLNFIYSVNDFMKIRTSYGRTVARPIFRELAPFNSFDFVGDFVLIGNENLDRTNIDNFDLRWEWYPTPSEIISVSSFYKKFTNPIERVINTQAPGGVEQTFRNVEGANVLGMEFEVKKRLNFLPGKLEHLRVGTNVSLIKSVLTVDAQELAFNQALNPDAPSTRPMFGQSPYSVNGELAYSNDTTGWVAALNFNVFGPRIASVIVGGGPNVIEKPRPSLDFSLSKVFFERLTIRMRARNLLNPEYKLVQQFNDHENVFQSYTVGRRFSIGLSYAIK